MGEVQGGAAPAAPSTNTEGSPLQQGAAVSGGNTDPSKAAPAAARAEEQRYEVKVNGQIRKLTLQEALSKASLSDAAMEKMQEAAKMRKEVVDFKEEAAKSKITALRKLGFSDDDIRSEFESWYKEKYIDPETLTAEEKALKERDAKIKEYEEREEKRQQQEQQQKQSALEAHTRNELETEIIKALDAGGLPKNRFTAGRVAFWMRENIRGGYDAPMETIIAQVKEEARAIATQQLMDVPIEQIIELVPDLIEKLRKYDTDRLNQKSVSLTPKQDTPKRSEKKTVRPSDVDNFFRALRQQKG